MTLRPGATGRATEYTIRAEKKIWTIRVAIGALLCAALGLASSNPLLTAANFAIVPLLFWLLWRAGEPPILLFAAGFQWLQVFTPVLNANRHDELIGASSALRDIEFAAWMGLVSIIVLAVGMRLALGRNAPIDARDLTRAVPLLNPRRLAIAYVLMFFVDGFVIRQLAAIVPGFRQPLLVLSTARWVVIFLIGWAAAFDRRFRGLASVILLIEVVLGFTGYFSSFKRILFLAIVIVAGAQIRMRRTLRPALVGLFLLTVVLGAFWQSIKGDYRVFLSQDERAQVVRVPVVERFRFLVNRATTFSFQDFQDGVESGLDRLGYLTYFAHAARIVPALIPHQNGRLWLEAVQHVLAPRIFFPNKPQIDDSDRTNEFTGERVATAEEGASISIGYVGESYIDFGPVLMFVPILALGFFWGWAYRRTIGWSRFPLLGLAIATNLILSLAMLFEASNVKILGGAITYLLVYWVVLRLYDRWIWSALARRRPFLRQRDAASAS